MAAFPGVLAAALRARRRLLLFGDFRQLPPVYLAQTPAARDWLGRDPFEISGVRERIDARQPEPRVTLLETQYRMAPPIAAVVSRLAYGGRLRDASGLELRDAAMEGIGPWSGSSVVLADTSGLGTACCTEPRPGSYSRLNPVQALLAASVAARALADGCGSVALITPYRAQARLLDRLCRRLGPPRAVTAATVHRFQGSESDLVVVDLVDAPPAAGASRLTGKDAPSALRLLNVAASRARCRLVVLADAAFVRRAHPRDSPALRLLELLEESGRSVALDVQAVQRDLRPPPGLWLDGWSAVQDALLQDLQQPREAVLLNLPQALEPGAALLERLAALAAAGARVRVHAPLQTALRLEDTRAELHLRTLPGGFLALLDRRVVYAGGDAPQAAVVRLEGAEPASLLAELRLGPASRGAVQAGPGRSHETSGSG
jgi:hypothetical protein